jgi:hypothetical protein
MYALSTKMGFGGEAVTVTNKHEAKEQRAEPAISHFLLTLTSDSLQRRTSLVYLRCGRASTRYSRPSDRVTE